MFSSAALQPRRFRVLGLRGLLLEASIRRSPAPSIYSRRMTEQRDPASGAQQRPRHVDTQAGRAAEFNVVREQMSRFAERVSQPAVPSLDQR